MSASAATPPSIIMSSSSPEWQPCSLTLELPWNSGEAQQQQFKSVLKRVLLILLLLFLIIPFLPQFEPDFVEEQTDLIITKVLLEPIPPPPLRVEPKPKPVEPPKPDKPVAKPKEIVPATAKAATIKTSSQQKATSADKTALKSDKVDKKISVRSSQGLNELSSQLSELRGSLDLTKLQNKNVSSNSAGSVATSARQRLGNAQTFDRSSGIDVDGSITRRQSTTLASRTTTAVDGLVTSDLGASGDQSILSSGGKSKRDDESIRRTMESVKSNATGLYRQALLDDPSFEGTLVVSLTIEPDGSISDLRLVSSNLGSKAFEDRFLSRIARLDFGAEDVEPRRLKYDYIFSPP
ncbi:MAG: AgmX/PglI C-terminal domain-containing protein [Pseudomonadota bacterium]